RPRHRQPARPARHRPPRAPAPARPPAGPSAPSADDRSYRLQVTLKQVKENPVITGAPQLPRQKAHAVQRLRLRPPDPSHLVRDRKPPAHRVHHPHPPPHVPRQPGTPRPNDAPGPPPLSTPH